MFLVLLEIEKDKNMRLINEKISELLDCIKSDDCNDVSLLSTQLEELKIKRKALRKELYDAYERQRNKERV